ncbi:MAG: hypothetical protein II028_04840, partial [Clostridia bacterium]|nr:hypothetical protein [Clostridia bacterium]
DLDTALQIAVHLVDDLLRAVGGVNTQTAQVLSHSLCALVNEKTSLFFSLLDIIIEKQPPFVNRFYTRLTIFFINRWDFFENSQSLYGISAPFPDFFGRGMIAAAFQRADPLQTQMKCGKIIWNAPERRNAIWNSHRASCAGCAWTMRR